MIPLIVCDSRAGCDASSLFFRAAPRLALSLALAIVLIVLLPLRASAEVRVLVEGVEGRLLENVLSYLSIAELRDHPDLGEWQVHRLHEKAEQEIREALQPFGYYHPAIKSELTEDKGIWTARYVVEPGKAVTVSRVDITLSGEGAGERGLAEMKDAFPLGVGDVLEHEPYEEGKRRFQDLAAGSGYLDARFLVHEVRVSLEKNSADIELRFDTGPLYRFGEVTFDREVLRREFLQGFVPFKRGDPYRVSKLIELQRSLSDSDYFSEVEVTPRRERVEGREVPVEVRLVPRKRHLYRFGLGYGTDTGFRGLLGWEDRRLNRRGHRLNAELQVSEIRNNLSARYVIPMRKIRTDHLDITAGWLDERTKTSESEVYTAGVSFTQARRNWQETYYLNYQNEKFSVAGDERRSTLFLPGASWTRVKAKDRIFATHGSIITFDVRGTHEAIGSDVSFLQLRLQAKLIRSLWEGGRFILRGDLGFSEVDEFDALPASQRFFAGGDRSVRGYRYNSLGPVDEKGEVTGGKHLLVGSIEYEHKIIGKWSAAVFYDFGNALDSLSGSLEHGTGGGIRWLSPVGPVRLDLAMPLSEPKDGWRIHLSIGPDF